MAGRKGNKAHANKTSLTSEQMIGNNAAEKWTFAAAESFFKQALIDSEDAITLNDVARAQGQYYEVFEYLCDKFPVFLTIKKQILRNIESNTYKGALNDTYVASVAIFGLKHNHGWTDKSQVDVTTKGAALGKNPLEFFESEPNE
jgi:hypothetical protein